MQKEREGPGPATLPGALSPRPACMPSLHSCFQAPSVGQLLAQHWGPGWSEPSLQPQCAQFIEDRAEMSADSEQHSTGPRALVGVGQQLGPCGRSRHPSDHSQPLISGAPPLSPSSLFPLPLP